MWKLFKESVWDYLIGKVLTVLGTLGTLWAIVVLVKPEYERILPVGIDNRVWYGVALVFMFAILLRTLKVAASYKKRIELTDNIRLVYDERRYKACKQVKRWEGRDIELYRVGIRVIGSEPVESLVVIPGGLRRVNDESYKEIAMSEVKLHPMTENIETIYGGLTSGYYVDVFQHEVGYQQIDISYDQHSEKYIRLENGQYELTLIAKGKPRTSHLGTMVITMKDGHVSVEIKKKDYLGG